MSRKKIVIDGRMVRPHLDGMGWYTTHLAQGLSELSSLKYDVAFLTAPDLPQNSPLRKFEQILSPIPFLSAREWGGIPRVLRDVGADLYHSPSFSSLLYSSVPWMVTVHDLNHLKYGSLQKKAYYHFILKRFIRQAKAVLTVSEFSKKEIQHWMGGDNPLPVDVVYNCIESVEVESSVAESVMSRLGVSSKKFFLALANPKPHKNIPFLLGAYARYRVKQGASAWPLVVTGNQANDYRSDGVILAGALSSEEAHGLLRFSGALLSPSLYEGFGRPPVEAVANGVSCLASSIAPHREGLRGVSPDRIRLLDPEDEDAWVEAMEAQSEGRISSPTQEDQAQVLTRFSVREMGMTMDRIYKRVIEL